MPDMGPQYGRKATWIGASGDQTFIKVDEALINPRMLENSLVFANQSVIGKSVVPVGFMVRSCPKRRLRLQLRLDQRVC